MKHLTCKILFYFQYKKNVVFTQVNYLTQAHSLYAAMLEVKARWFLNHNSVSLGLLLFNDRKFISSLGEI